jgi:hypothetical protein
MRITSGQLARLIIYVHDRYAGGPYDLSSPRAVCGLILQDFPEIDGVAPPPSPEELRRRYIENFWRSYEAPSFESEPAATIGPESRANREYNDRLRAMYHGGPVPSPAERMMSELDLLRSNPMGALTYVTMRACHYNNSEAMRYARISGAVWDVVAAGTPAPVSDVTGRVEPSTSRVPEEYTPDFIARGLSTL